MCNYLVTLTGRHLLMVFLLKKTQLFLCKVWLYSLILHYISMWNVAYLSSTQWNQSSSRSMFDEYNAQVNLISLKWMMKCFVLTILEV